MIINFITLISKLSSRVDILTGRVTNSCLYFISTPYRVKLISFFLYLVRQHLGLDLNLGIGSVLKDNNQPKYDGSTSNTHSTVIKGPLGLPILTVSHTHGSSGVANKPDPSVSNNGLLFDHLGQTTVNTNKPKCMKNSF